MPVSKLSTLSQAISSHVHDGDLVYAAGFTHLIPFAAAHEIIRQGKKNLTLARATPDIIYDQLVAAGCARKLIFSYSGNPGVGSLRIIRAEMEAGRLEYEEYSHFAMITRLTAGAAGLPFLPMKSVGTDDLVKANPQYRTVVDPYGGETLNTVPALNPDVAIIHAQRACANGEAQIWGIIGEQKEAAFASKRVIVTAEEIVDEAVIRADPNRTIIPGFRVNAVVEQPWGAYPVHLAGCYNDGPNAFGMMGDEEAYNAYLQAAVWGVKDWNEYLDNLKKQNGPEFFERIKIKNPAMSDPIVTGI